MHAAARMHAQLPWTMLTFSVGRPGDDKAIPTARLRSLLHNWLPDISAAFYQCTMHGPHCVHSLHARADWQDSNFKAQLTLPGRRHDRGQACAQHSQDMEHLRIAPHRALDTWLERCFERSLIALYNDSDHTVHCPCMLHRPQELRAAPADA